MKRKYLLISFGGILLLVLAYWFRPRPAGKWPVVVVPDGAKDVKVWFDETPVHRQLHARHDKQAPHLTISFHVENDSIEEVQELIVSHLTKLGYSFDDGPCILHGWAFQNGHSVSFMLGPPMDGAIEVTLMQTVPLPRR